MADSPSFENEKGFGNEKDKEVYDVETTPAFDEDGPVEFAEKAELRSVFWRASIATKANTNLTADVVWHNAISR